MILLRFFRNSSLCFFSLFMIACSDAKHSDLNEWVQGQRNTARPRIQPLSEPLVFSPQSYVSAEGMDPFSRTKLTQVLNRDSQQNSSNIELLNAEQNRRKEDLENYPLDSVVMVGSLKKDGLDTALLKVNNLIYPIKSGSYVGQNYGRIIQIDEQSIKLREIVQDPVGDWVERITTLDLQEGNK